MTTLLSLLVACTLQVGDEPTAAGTPNNPDGVQNSTGTTPSAAVEDCTDLVDNDGDGQIDCLDPDCDGQCAERCADGRDNDGDGQVDCADPDCAELCIEDCDNGVDDDSDGHTDCADLDCACPEVCDNGLDDDRDGRTDCSDPDCLTAGGVTSDGDTRVCDVDGDGHVSTLQGGEDCDDTDASVHPDATEICGDGIDQDCDMADQPCPVDSATQPPLDTGADDTAVPVMDSAAPVDSGDEDSGWYYTGPGTAYD